MMDGRLVYQCLCLMAGMHPALLSTADVLFVWGRAKGNWEENSFNEGTLQLSARLYHHCRHAHAIVIPGYIGQEKGQGLYGYPGPEVWKQELVRRYHIPPLHVKTTKGEGFNTKTEMDDMLDLAQANNWQTIIGVTHFTHALRAMLGTVKSLQNRGLMHYKVLPCWPTKFDLSQQSYGSQGQGPFSRAEWIDQEFERIPRYQEEGDLATLEELRDYLLTLRR